MHLCLVCGQEGVTTLKRDVGADWTKYGVISTESDEWRNLLPGVSSPLTPTGKGFLQSGVRRPPSEWQRMVSPGKDVLSHELSPIDSW